jgi:hypothetical protein
MGINRRKVIEKGIVSVAGYALAGTTLANVLAAGAQTSVGYTPPDRPKDPQMTDPSKIDAWLKTLRNRYKWQNASVDKLVEDAYRTCVMPNIREPEGLLRRKWLSPDSNYNGHWIWDAMLLADLLS